VQAGYGTIAVDVKEKFVDRQADTMKRSVGQFLKNGRLKRDDVDKVRRLFNWPMGAFELSRPVGIDVCVDLLDGIHEQTGLDRCKPTPLPKRMLEAECTGRKAGKGFCVLLGKGQNL
jgi:3-hydroxyacyl-CoA dehydrogenase